jgi:hypothetical protein
MQKSLDFSCRPSARYDGAIIAHRFSLLPQAKTSVAPSHAQYSTALSAQLQGWWRRKARRLPEAWHEVALGWLRLDLAPAHPLWRALYAPSARGRPPDDPVCLLRALLLLLLLQHISLPKWADDLRAHARLAQMAGFSPCQTPAVGTFYTLLDRLEAGAYTPACPHRVRPSQPRTGRPRRHRQQEKAPRHAAKTVAAAQVDSVTKRLAQALLATADQPRPLAWLTRLADLGLTCGGLPSARRGLRGALSALVLGGDGAVLP